MGGGGDSGLWRWKGTKTPSKRPLSHRGAGSQPSTGQVAATTQKDVCRGDGEATTERSSSNLRFEELEQATQNMALNVDHAGGNIGNIEGGEGGSSTAIKERNRSKSQDRLSRNRGPMKSSPMPHKTREFRYTVTRKTTNGS